MKGVSKMKNNNAKIDLAKETMMILQNRCKRFWLLCEGFFSSFLSLVQYVKHFLLNKKQQLQSLSSYQEMVKLNFCLRLKDSCEKLGQKARDCRGTETPWVSRKHIILFLFEKKNKICSFKMKQQKRRRKKKELHNLKTQHECKQKLRVLKYPREYSCGRHIQWCKHLNCESQSQMKHTNTRNYTISNAHNALHSK